MGRFGNLFLTSGDPELRLEARAGEVARLWLTNTANTRVFNVALPGAQMKLIGGDSGRYEHEELVDQVLLAPSERAVVDVLIDRPGQLSVEHHTPDRAYRLATLTVTEERAPSLAAEQFGVLRRAPELAAERQGLDAWLAAAPNKALALVAQMEDPAAMPAGTGPVTYACPMHPEVTSEEPGRCPKCGMRLLATQVSSAPTSYACPMHPEVTSEEPGRCPKCGMKLLACRPGGQPQAGHDDMGMHHDGAAMHHGTARNAHGAAVGDRAADGIEWEDDMVEVNRLTTSATMHWRFLDRTGGVDSQTIDWRFRVGDRVKIQLVNDMESDHPMHHPIHLHGAGRFLVLARDGVVEPNLVWKDTVLVRTGQTVDIMFDVTKSRAVDGALPYRRAHAERHDVQLQRRAQAAGSPVTPKGRQHLVEEGLAGGGVQAGGAGDDTVHVEDDRRERRVCRWGRGGVRRGMGQCLADVVV